MTPLQKQLSGLYRNQHLLGLLLFSLVTIIIWVSIGLITSQSKTSLPPELQKMAKSLNPTLNTEVLDQIEDKKTFSDEELRSFPIYRILSERSDRARASAAPTTQTTGLGTLTGANEEASSSTQPAVVVPTSPAATSSATTEESDESGNSDQEI